MELRTLRYFVAIADHGGVTPASAAVRVAQPALSRQLRGLERELGTALFERGRGRLTLTAAGAALLPLARDLLYRAEGLRAEAHGLASGRLRHLRIAAPPTTITDVVAPFIAESRPDDPMPSVAAASPPELHHLLDRRAADLVLSPTAPPPHLDSRRIADFPIWLYVRPPEPEIPGDVVEIAALDPARLLVLPRHFAQRQLLERAAARAGLALDAVREVTSPEIAQALAAAGGGHAVVSDESRFGLRGVRIDTGGGILTMPVYAAWHPRHVAARQLAGTAERLTEFCASHFAQA
ncbi:LysR family transcriptional regulator [Phytohabitans sp. ZYX-F-186]|uniref:LysR family transcriptional regulator n=1 Tax=Phytohabitans maris TaxID=3071409 RepID=A0ABU0ZDS1_9ACTN|nr:LysR family transcriptional regulator [Phytohabitans sp. ZYX-F-186]MDQ7905206.1 LysR family transcriptional regulator [Phytohabitans sp. ZYX-F-186]